MNKWLVSIIFLLFPILALADQGSLSFAPPASDISVVFLGNLFGVVDGVLSGTGSQIMGSMFAVFNSAVLSVGGIIIMYTMMVATMNTAHTGQMLGQKWSSIWIPVRSTIGLALLIPKASGYCMMQIFVMWVVVQGVGAADKIWAAALGYMNRGGVIIKAQTNPLQNISNVSGTQVDPVPTAAQMILTQQVCMLGLQKQLESIRKDYIARQQNNGGPCSGSPTGDMKDFCDTPVPDFIGSVNAVAEQNKNEDLSVFTLKAPNLPDKPYNALNGICGSLQWNNIVTAGSDSKNNTPDGSKQDNRDKRIISSGVQLEQDQYQAIKYSRAIAIQQMIVDLSAVAQVMINNDPKITPTLSSNASSAQEQGNNDPASVLKDKPDTSNDYSLNAKLQFGVPYSASGLCDTYAENCTSWGGVDSGGMLFNGTEFQSALNDYNGIMAPTLNFFNQIGDKNNAQQSRAFIEKANNQGWIMAGAYFFDLVALNGNAAGTRAKLDQNTGLDKSTAIFGALNEETGTCNTQFGVLCEWINNEEINLQKLKDVRALINGTDTIPDSKDLKPLNPVTINKDKIQQLGVIKDSKQDSSVYGFINNSLMVRLPGQPGLAPLTFANIMSINVNPNPNPLPDPTFDCGRVGIWPIYICLGRLLGKLFYNTIFKTIVNFFMNVFYQFVSQIIMAFLVIPLSSIAAIFQAGLNILSQPGVNPVIALAKMGTYYINYASNLWLNMLTMVATPMGLFLFPLFMIIMPLILAWLTVMVGVGFVTAYYVPILPYTIFIFGAIAWLISVIEAMAAAPIVALGVTHPEGHDALGKGEQAIMLLMNVFLRPALMIIGYIAGIAMCYVGVWILNVGFDHAISFMQNGGQNAAGMQPLYEWAPSEVTGSGTGTGKNNGGYSDWAGIYAFFFSILIYTSTYLAIVQQAFSLIAILPDKVLRWIGGSPEGIGQEAMKWGEEMKGQAKEAGKVSSEAQGQVQKATAGKTMELLGKFSGQGGKGKASGGKSGGGAGGAGGGGGDDDAAAKAASAAAGMPPV